MATIVVILLHTEPIPENDNDHYHTHTPNRLSRLSRALMERAGKTDMALYHTHILHLFGPTEPLTTLLDTSGWQKDDAHLLITPKPNTLPAMSAHDIMAWTQDKVNREATLRATLKRPAPFPVTDWEARLTAMGHDLAPVLEHEPSPNVKLTTRISTLRLLYAMMPGLANLPMPTGPTGLPDTIPSELQFFSALQRCGILDGWAGLKTLDTQTSHLTIDFGWHRNFIPGSALATENLLPSDMPDIHIVEMLMNDSEFTPQFGYRMPGAPMSDITADTTTAPPIHIEDMETAHDWAYWLGFESTSFPRSYLPALFGIDRAVLKARYEESTKA